jgi:hypothetical protein
MTMKKILLAVACTGLLGFSAAPASAAGPMMSGATDRTVNSDTVHQAEYRGDRWRGHRQFHSPRHGHGQWRHRYHNSPRYGHPHWGNRHYYAPHYAPRYGYWGNYHRPHRGNFGNWRW